MRSGSQDVCGTTCGAALRKLQNSSQAPLQRAYGVAIQFRQGSPVSSLAHASLPRFCLPPAKESRKKVDAINRAPTGLLHSRLSSSACPLGRGSQELTRKSIPQVSTSDRRHIIHFPLVAGILNSKWKESKSMAGLSGATQSINNLHRAKCARRSTDKHHNEMNQSVPRGRGVK